MNLCLLVLYLYSALLIITNKDQVGNKDETKKTNSNRQRKRQFSGVKRYQTIFSNTLKTKRI